MSVQTDGRARRALITGASSGLGASVAEKLAARGWAVWLAARRVDRLAEVAAAIRAAGGVAEPVALDVADAEATARRVVGLAEQCGGFDLVIANAGVGGMVSPKKLDWAVARPTLMTNFVGAAATLVPLVPRMLARGRGQLVGISSLAGELPLSLSSQYGATKAGLTYMLLALRAPLRRKGVVVTVVHPGFVATEMTAGAPFPMPFLLGLDDAAERIVRGVLAGKRLVRFPWPLALAIRVANWLPLGLREWVVARLRL